MNDTKQAAPRHSSEFLPCEISKKPHLGAVNATGTHQALLFLEKKTCSVQSACGLKNATPRGCLDFWLQ